MRTQHGAGRLTLLIVVAALIGVIAVVHRRGEGIQSSAPDSNITDAAQRSLTEYWTDEEPKVYNKQFTQLAGGFQPKTPQSRPFTCGGQSQTYGDLRGNAFYCSGGEDYIAWDAAELFPQLTERFGSVAPAIVLAHETGHAIQTRAGVDAPSVVRELQADCFAGSWTHFAETSADDPVTLTDTSLDTAVATILTLRDQPGTSGDAQQAHGLGFDRVNAYQTGYEHGAERCAQFPEQGVTTTELPFRTVSEAASGGNLPYDQAVDVLSQSLNAFWTNAVPQLATGRRFSPPRPHQTDGDKLPSCADEPAQDGLSQYCAASGSVDWLSSSVERAHEQIGDLATGAVLSDAWAEAGQTAAGLPVDGQKAGLQRDCFTGAWLKYLAQGGRSDTQLSPGDLDEALTEIVVSSFDANGHRSDRGGAFERSTALRAGVFGGPGAC
jgi:predicted metalloprotease